MNICKNCLNEKAVPKTKIGSSYMELKFSVRFSIWGFTKEGAVKSSNKLLFLKWIEIGRNKDVAALAPISDYVWSWPLILFLPQMHSKIRTGMLNKNWIYVCIFVRINFSTVVFSDLCRHSALLKKPEYQWLVHNEFAT